MISSSDSKVLIVAESGLFPTSDGAWQRQGARTTYIAEYKSRHVSPVDTLQHTAARCDVMPATSSRVLEHHHASTQQHTCSRTGAVAHCNTHWDTLQHTATHLQQGGLFGLAQLHTVTNCNTHCNTLQHICNKKTSSVLRDCGSNILQLSATQCNTLQHICNKNASLVLHDCTSNASAISFSCAAFAAISACCSTVSAAFVSTSAPCRCATWACPTPGNKGQYLAPATRTLELASS